MISFSDYSIECANMFTTKYDMQCRARYEITAAQVTFVGFNCILPASFGKSHLGTWLPTVMRSNVGAYAFR